MSVRRGAANLALLMSAVMLITAIVICARSSKKDKFGEWRHSYGIHMIEVIYDGEKYYCDHAESPAGYPDRLILYRGDDHYLVFPEKYSIRKLRPLPNSGVSSGE